MKENKLLIFGSFVFMLLALCQACTKENIDMTIIEEEVPVDTILCDLLVTIFQEEDSMDMPFLWVDLQGGTAPFNYLWSDSNKADTLLVIANGTYSVTVTDNNQCTSTADFDYESPDPCAGFQITSIQVVTDSFPTTYSLTPQLMGGTAPFYYLWSEGSTVETLVTDVSDTYSVTVTDNEGCTDEEVITL